MFKELLTTGIDLIYENRCGVCRIPTFKDELICPQCNPEINLLPHTKLLAGSYCLKCGEGIQHDASNVCQSCYLYPLPVGFIRSVWSYTASSEAAICAYKYAHSRSLADFLSKILISSINSGIFPPEARYNWNLILPIPSTEESLRQRAFSPMGQITKIMAKNLDLPLSLLALQTIGNHPPQASLSPAERLKHIKRKYRANSKLVLKRRILLVDDVITSGASLLGSSLALLNAGAESIDCLSICRSELFSQLRAEISKKF